MGCVCRPALAPIRGRGVSELYVLGDVIGGERDLAAPIRKAQPQGAVGIGGGDDPAVTILDPGSACRDEPVVLAGHHFVADPCFLPVSYH